MTTTTSPSDLVNAYFAANPNATTSDVANAVQQNGGLTSDLASALAQHYGTDVATVNSAYNNLINQASNNNQSSTSIASSPSTTTSTPSGISSTPTGTLATGWQDQAISLPVGNLTPSSNTSPLITAANTQTGSTTSSPLSVNATTQTSPLTQLQGVANTVNNLTSGSQSESVMNNLISAITPLASQGNSFAQAILNSKGGNYGLPNQLQNYSSDIQNAIQAYQTANPNATASDVANAAANYEKTTGTSASDLYSALGNLAQSNPVQYESLLQKYNTSQNIDPSKQFYDYLKQNSTIAGNGEVNLPDSGAIIEAANQTGFDLSKLNNTDIQNQLFGGRLISNQNILSNAANDSKIKNVLASNGINNANQNQFVALSQVVNAPTNSSDYQNMTKLANAGVTPAMYSQVTGLNPKLAVGSFDYFLNPQAPSDLLATQAGLPKGTQYTYGVNSFNTPVLLYTDPKSGQQMAYTAGSGMGYQAIPAAKVQSNLLPYHNQGVTYTYGQSSYVSPFNSDGTINTTSAPALQQAYKSGLIDQSTYLNNMQKLNKTT